ncbi:MAG: VOC family protein [Gaiellaceae bacterium]
MIERTDFYSVPVQDMERAKAFYRDTLGMHSPDWDAGFPEIETGNVSLYLVDPTALGGEFAPHAAAPFALRVDDVPARRAEL